MISFAISSNLDNMGVGMAYGIRGTCISFTANLTVAAMNSAGTIISMLAGGAIARMIDFGASGLLGGIIMMGTGVWVMMQGSRYRVNSVTMDSLYEGFRNYPRMSFLRRTWEIINNPLVVNPHCKDIMGRAESIALGLGLTLSNLVTGFAAGMIGLNIIVLTFLTIIAGILAMWLGHLAGDSRAFRWIGKYGGVASGSLLIMIGFLKIFL